VGLIVAGLVGVVLLPGSPTSTIVAEFSEAPGLYAGNHVEVLGIPVGTVTSIRPEPGFVKVTMRVSRHVKVPADAYAVIMAPQVVADRFVQLQPAYTGGSALGSGAVIPPSRTAIPESVDAVIGALNNLAAQLGPSGANRSGALSALVSELAKQIGTLGPDFHGAVVNFSQALGDISLYAPQLGELLNNLGGLNQALATNSTTYAQFTAELSQVSGILASDRSELAQTLSALQQLFANLTSFINADGANLGASVANLDQLASTLSQQQASLAQTLDLSPLALENLDATVDKSAPGGPAVRARYDAVGATQGLFNQVCGNPALRFLALLATNIETNPLTPATPTDTLCAIGNALNAFPPVPGAPSGPNLTLSALVP
jgi:phospholipid/cholesterol/gamma-HCH transport system substrate-binding protein